MTVKDITEHTDAFIPSSLGHNPDGAWEFDAEVTEVFDDMLIRSIPQYDVMRQACYALACQYQKPKTAIIDLGCSRGGAIASLIDEFGANNTFIGVEISEPMLAASRRRFKTLIDVGIVDIREIDLRTGFPAITASVVMCVLTLQFTPIEYRQRILHDIYTNLIPGGALILVEKVLGASQKIDESLIDIYYGFKHESGYSWDEIERKRLSLEGRLVPVTASMNEQMLSTTGFYEVDSFWRWMNFMGWLAIKPE